MSYFEDASLVMIPSGIKDQKVYSIKPTDGSGDLTFSRASNATRVNSSGLVEKVRTNVVLYSELQTAGVYQISSGIDSVTAVSNPITGQNNAFKITTNTTDDPYFFQNITGLTNGENTVSYWLWTDSGQSTEATMFFYNAGASEIYTQEVTLTTTPTRYSFTVNFTNIGALAAVRLDLRQVGPSIQYVYTYGWQAESGVMTDYIATTTTAVSVGPVSGLPRLDYSGGASCPSLLLESQRTNLATFSEQINATTVTLNAATLTENQFLSPDGYTNADKLTETATASQHRFIKTTSLGGSVDSSAYVISLFVKYAGRGKVQLSDNNQAVNGLSKFNLETKSVISGTGKIEDYGNGWLRLSIYPIKDTSTTSSFFFNMLNEAGDPFYTGDGTSATALYGCQIEAGAYATSYIPTLSSAVTRVADSASKTGISSLIGQTEGTVFYDFVWNGATTSTADYPIVLSGSDFNNFIGLNSTFNSNQLLAYSGGSAVASISGADFVVGQRYKIALAYKANDFVYYVNGTPQGSDTSGAVPIGLANLQMVTPFGSKSTVQNANSILLFKTRLSNADLATLTA